jgi:hypothetical protein
VKAAGRTLRLSEVLLPADFELYIGTEDGQIPVSDVDDDGVLIPSVDLYTYNFQEAHDLMVEIAHDPKAWTKKRIMDSITEYMK